MEDGPGLEPTSNKFVVKYQKKFLLLQQKKKKTSDRLEGQNINNKRVRERKCVRERERERGRGRKKCEWVATEYPRKVNRWRNNK